MHLLYYLGIDETKHKCVILKTNKKSRYVMIKRIISKTNIYKYIMYKCI